MSNFIFIIPPDWVQVTQEVIDAIGTNLIVGWITVNDFYSLSQALETNGGPSGVSEAIFFNSEILAVR